MQADHRWPYSLFGETSWSNLEYLCGDCNLKKSNFIDITIRSELGRGTFREILSDYLRSQPSVEAAVLDRYFDPPAVGDWPPQDPA